MGSQICTCRVGQLRCPCSGLGAMAQIWMRAGTPTQLVLRTPAGFEDPKLDPWVASGSWESRPCCTALLAWFYSLKPPHLTASMGVQLPSSFQVYTFLTQQIIFPQTPSFNKSSLAGHCFHQLNTSVPNLYLSLHSGLCLLMLSICPHHGSPRWDGEKQGIFFIK